MNIDYIYRKQKDIPSGYQYYTIADKNKFMEGWDPKYNIEQGLKKYMEYLK